MRPRAGRWRCRRGQRGRETVTARVPAWGRRGRALHARPPPTVLTKEVIEVDKLPVGWGGWAWRGVVHGAEGGAEAAIGDANEVCNGVKAKQQGAQ